MPLKIIGAGFGRTGTMSTYAALNQLGFPCYHMIEVLENKANKSHLGFWAGVADAPQGTRHDWERVFSNYTAAVDNPAACVWRELMQDYPDAKVLLTLHPRGPEVWYESTIDTIYFTENKWQFQVLKYTTLFGHTFGGMSRKLIWERFLKGSMRSRETAIAQYQRHIEEVKAAVPPERLLVFSVDQGWEPLCAFIGVPVPQSEFPDVNDRAAIKQIVSKMTRGAYVILGAGGAVLAGLAYAAVRLLS